ncbi:MAG: VWA domain-containing protein [Caldilineales bacterium]
MSGRPTDTLQLVGEYSYVDGVPAFHVLPGESSPYLVYRKQPVRVEQQKQLVTIALNDVSIDVTPFDPAAALGIRAAGDGSGTTQLPDYYRIKPTVTAEEFIDGEWVHFSEFEAKPRQIANIGIAVIVDSSKSIDRQLGPAKAAANYLAALLESRWGDHLWVSVAPMDPGAQYLGFTNDAAAIKTYIAGLESVPYTPLYDVIASVCDAFDAFEFQHAGVDPRFSFNQRWILLLTDGRDNYSNLDLGDVQQRLAQSNVAVYALGIEALNDLDQKHLGRLSQQRLVALTGLEQERLREARDGDREHDRGAVTCILRHCLSAQRPADSRAARRSV